MMKYKCFKVMVCFRRKTVACRSQFILTKFNMRLCFLEFPETLAPVPLQVTASDGLVMTDGVGDPLTGEL